jgi:hypothetical protein
MKEKIEEIINKYTTNYRIISISREVLPSNHNENFVNDLYTIIQEERENAYSSGFDDCKKLTDILVGIKKKEAVEGFITDFIETGVYEGVGSIEDIMKLWRKYNAHN